MNLFFARRRVMMPVVFLLLSGMAVFSSCRKAMPEPAAELRTEIFGRLLQTRSGKKQQVMDYFNQIQQDAISAREDNFLLGLFRPGTRITPDTEYKIDLHFVEHYSNFYDILFVDKNGYVFHSIKKEKDYHTNLGEAAFSSDLKNSLHTPSEKFTDFVYYPPSQEAAAFFTLAVEHDNIHSGWLILQVAANQVNSILTDRKNLGKTGEVYLVNSSKLMLSDSRFIEDSTILKKKIETDAVQNALASQTGESIIRDYRGIEVFSSWENFEIFGTSWIIIAEIDEAEVLTEHYMANREYYNEQIIEHLAAKRPAASAQMFIPGGKKVEINEFGRSSGEGRLFTRGVATCTAVSIGFPDRFVYLAHVTPVDDIYENGFISHWLNGKDASFLESLVERIRYYEIRPAETNRLQAVIVAPHTKSLAGAIELLIRQGIFVSNIRMVWNPSAVLANYSAGTTIGSSTVEWKEKNRVWSGSVSNIESVAKIMKRIMSHPG